MSSEDVDKIKKVATNLAPKTELKNTERWAVIQARPRRRILRSREQKAAKKRGAEKPNEELGRTQLDFASWLDRFLEERRLQNPSGDMLFSYRASKEEYLTLRALFAQSRKHLRGVPWRTGSQAECACFVLYAAEWWRREYAGGHWRWQDILDSVQPNISLDHFERALAVERGLGYWGHKVSDSGKKYLGSIVAQGGLPLQLIAHGDGSISRMLMRGVRQAQLYRWDSAQCEAYFEACAEDLVQHMREPSIYRLLAAVVQTVLVLRQEFQLAGISRPVEKLEQQLPAWRERFPIAVDDEAADSLLVGLVREAAREVRAVSAYPVLATRSLHVRDDGVTYDLALALATPASMQLAALARACNVPEAAIPQAFSLELPGERRERLGEGRQLLGAESVVMLTCRSRRLLGQEAVDERTMVLRGMGVDLHSPVGIPGAETMDPDEPWVFVSREFDTTLFGTGSVRVPDERCLVAVAVHTRVTPQGAESVVTERGCIDGLTERRRLIEVKGACAVASSEVHYIVQTRQGTHHSEQFVLRGRRSPYSGGPRPIYQGVPELCRLTPDGELVPVGPHEIEWRHAHARGPRIAHPKQHRGPVDAWLMQNGQSRRRFGMVLIDRDARVRFESGDRLAGAIEFHGWGLEALAVRDIASGPAITRGEAMRIDLSVSDHPPAKVRIDATWSPRSPSQWLDLPFPAMGGRFSGENGKLLAPNASLPLRQLHGVRVQVFDRNPDRPKRYTLIAELKTNDGSRRAPRTRHSIVIDAQGFGELRLFEIELTLLGLMSQSDELDARLELCLDDGTKTVAKIYLTRYDVGLERHAFSVAISDDCLARLEQDAIDSVHLSALPMLATHADTRPLTQARSADVPEGRWDTTCLSADEGPWLIYPTSASTLQVRPTLHAGLSIGPTHHPLEEYCALGRAMNHAEPGVRMDAIGYVIEAMAADRTHPSWQLIAQHRRHLAHLPLSTFDYWRVIAKNMSACLMVLLTIPGEADLMIRMRTELGVMWELVPRPVIAHALMQSRKFWANTSKCRQEDEFCRNIVDIEFSRLADGTVPLFDDLINITLWECGAAVWDKVEHVFRKINAGVGTILNELWHGEHSLLQRLLLRSHADEHSWPRYDLTEGLAQALSTLAPEPFQHRLAPFVSQLLWMRRSRVEGAQGPDVQEDVANVPLLAGLLSQCIPSGEWWKPGNRAGELRRIRNFDPIWFEEAFRRGVLIGLSLEQPGTEAEAVTPSIAVPVPSVAACAVRRDADCAVSQPRPRHLDGLAPGQLSPDL